MLQNQIPVYHGRDHTVHEQKLDNFKEISYTDIVIHFDISDISLKWLQLVQ